jgi:hypothetical protein
MPRQLLDETRVKRQTFEETAFAEAGKADREYRGVAAPLTSAWKRWN